MKSQTAAVTFELLFCKWMRETVSGTDQPDMGNTEGKYNVSQKEAFLHHQDSNFCLPYFLNEYFPGFVARALCSFLGIDED